MTTGNNANLFASVVNNAILDPLQGFDADVWVIDQGTGNYNLIGRFTSIQVTIRNATEPYLELNQRVPRLLDGEFQFGWVLERGMLDARVLEQTFGFNAITRELRNSRNTRFQISFSCNAPELESTTENLNPAGVVGTTARGSNEAGNANVFASRKTIGEYVLTFCKVDSFTMGVNAGRNVIANRWEGMCEGIEFVNRNVVTPGVFLNSVRADQALETSRAGFDAIGNNNPFSWDNELLTDNRATGGTRNTNPLAGDFTLSGTDGEG